MRAVLDWSDHFAAGRNFPDASGISVRAQIDAVLAALARVDVERDRLRARLVSLDERRRLEDRDHALALEKGAAA